MTTRKLTVSEERDRYKAALKDFAEHCPYAEGRRTAAAALDLSQPLKLSIPLCNIGKR